jgi:dipeptidyl aminopeptidase/acylaminoacyl peptidase
MTQTMQTIFTVVLLCVANILHAAPDLEAYGILEQISDMSISPNGELIAYRHTESDDKDFIIVFSLKEKKSVAALDVQEIDPRGHYFASNDYLVIIGAQRMRFANYKDEVDFSTVFSFDFKKNKLKQLIRPGDKLIQKKFVTPGQSGMGSVLGKSADSKTLYIPAFVSNSDTDNAPNYHLLGVNINGKGKINIARKGKDYTRNFFLGKDGNVLARENLDNKTNLHSIEAYSNGKWKTVYRYKSSLKTHSFIGLNADYSALIFSRSDDDKDYLQLDLANGEIKPFKGLDATKSTTGLITNNHGVVIGLKYAGFLPDYQLLDSKLNERVQAILAQFENHSVHISDWSNDWKHIVVRVEGTSHAGNYFLFSEGKAPFFLKSSRLNINSKDINTIATTEFKARDKLTIPTILTIPNSRIDNFNNLPTVVLPHGGPASHDRVGFDFMAQALASRGYLVIQPQFRGSTGFGKKHYEAGWGQWGKGMQGDLTDAVKVFSKLGYVDPNKVCIVGASYGGYAALAGAAFTPEIYKCAVSIAGVSHLPKMLAADRSKYGRKSWVLDYWNRSILASDYNKGTLKQSSPYYSAEKIKIPVLLIHGEDDDIVEYEQSRLMYKAMKKAKGNVKLVKLKNDDHHLKGSATRIQAITEMVKFVEKNIGG